MRPQLSLIICTRNRASVLDGAFAAVAELAPPESWELVVVDNGSADGTPEVITNWRDRLPIRASYERVAGKSHALNRALSVASGELLVFTDDDVRPSRYWLTELLRASRYHANAGGFAGPIIPAFPCGTPEWMPNCTVAELAFARFNPQLPEGLLPKLALPMGPNIAVRAEAVKGYHFRPDLGPSSLGPYMCEDTDFSLYLRDGGQQLIFVPSAPVSHCIRPEMINLNYQLERAFYFGRSIFRLRHHLFQFGMTSVENGSWDDECWRFQRAVRVNAYYGQICEAEAEGDVLSCQALFGMLCALRWNGDPSLLSVSTRAWLADRECLVPAPVRRAWRSLRPEHSASAA